MWTTINQVYASPHSMNAWAHLAGTGAWHKILPTSTDGCTNVFVLLVTAKGNNRQAHVVLDANKNIIAAYM